MGLAAEVGSSPLSLLTPHSNIRVDPIRADNVRADNIRAAITAAPGSSVSR
jgi:hypothetical protein